LDHTQHRVTLRSVCKVLYARLTGSGGPSWDLHTRMVLGAKLPEPSAYVQSLCFRFQIAAKVDSV